MYYQLHDMLARRCNAVWSDYLTDEELDGIDFDYFSDINVSVFECWTQSILDTYKFDDARFWAIRDKK